jgi:hypothetical protein
MNDAETIFALLIKAILAYWMLEAFVAVLIFSFIFGFLTTSGIET